MADEERPLVVSVETAARLLDSDVNTVRHWIKTGTVPAIKIGDRWRIRMADIERISREGTGGSHTSSQA